MSELVLFNPLLLSDEQFETIEGLAALNYTPAEMAIYLELDLGAFKKAMNKENSKIAFHITAGKLRRKFLVSDKLRLNAESGNITAAQELNKIDRRAEVEAIKRKIMFYEED